MVRVVIGLSGGVDSAISALLLKQRGFDLHAIYMVNWDAQEAGSSSCPRSRDEEDARSVASRLRIPFHSVNFVKEYWNEVFTRMLSNYARGRTVVPDVDCNRRIKFDHLHRVAQKRFAADYIATGHYASTSYGDLQEKRDDGRCRLLCGVDPLKDQSYFLSTLREEQLKRAMFPLGSLTKKAVKTIAEENGFTDISRRPESMGICFVGKQHSFGSFLDSYIVPVQGVVRDAESGRVLADHSGVHLFTLGKRLSIGPRSHLGYFVAAIHGPSSTVYACEGSHHPVLYAQEFIIEEPEWIVDPPSDATPLTCRIQRTHVPVPCRLRRLSPTRLIVQPHLPLRAAASGQMCVFYSGRECLGAGEVQGVLSSLASPSSLAFRQEDCAPNTLA